MATLSRRNFVGTGTAAAGLAIYSHSRIARAAGESQWQPVTQHDAQSASGSVIVGIRVD